MKKNEKHTILGAGGAIGNSLTDELLKHQENVRLVSRSGAAVEGAESVKGDFTIYADTLNAVQGSDVVYLCAGLQYDSRVWEEQWPKIMQNTIDACKHENAKLIFFDNVYMYGKVEGTMTEKTPYNPSSKKGEIRARIARKLEDEMTGGELDAIIARSADFYGPYALQTSIPYVMAISKLLKGKKAQWLVDARKLHSLTYTLDCGKALYLLAKNPNALNQVWHLPTYNPAITGEEFIKLGAKELGVAPKYSVLPKMMVKLGKLFDRTIYELDEMLYQNQFDYHFDSTKFNTYFKFEPTSYADGIRETIAFAKEQGA
ncbi:MAG TPA: NAD-dependent epimerase/dehydratase family protein [Sunxiuqinia sp.]|nr:NAD-dependent epimerase/dehydratase family protein [Sunxiuqinia sp.]